MNTVNRGLFRFIRALHYAHSSICIAIMNSVANGILQQVPDEHASVILYYYYYVRDCLLSVQDAKTK